MRSRLDDLLLQLGPGVALELAPSACCGGTLVFGAVRPFERVAKERAEFEAETMMGGAVASWPVDMRTEEP